MGTTWDLFRVVASGARPNSPRGTAIRRCPPRLGTPARDIPVAASNAAAAPEANSARRSTLVIALHLCPDLVHDSDQFRTDSGL